MTAANYEPFNGFAKVIIDENPAIYSVKVTSDGHGTAYAKPTEGPVGTEVTLFATPNDFCRFVKWEVISGGVTVSDDKFVIGTSDVEVEAIFEEVKDPFDVKVTIYNIQGNGKKGVPSDVRKMTLTPSLTLEGGKHSVGSDKMSVTVSPGNYKIEKKVTFSNKLPDFPSSLYKVIVEGLPKRVSSGGKNDRKYLLSYDAWINKEGGITINLKWTDGSWHPEEVYVYKLPEDEIGAYSMDAFGNKTYLLFHTYDICMAYLGSDELCSGYERCFHKEIPFIYDGKKIWGQ